MMDTLKSFSIPFKGLKEDIHHFDFHLDGEFFTSFENEELKDSEFEVKLALEKKPNMLELHFDITGDFKTTCDRCMDELTIPIDTSRHMYAKYHSDAEDDDLITLADRDTEVDIARPLYETVVLSLPLKRAHAEEVCDPEVLDRLDTYSRNDDEETDPRWDALKNLK